MADEYVPSLDEFLSDAQPLNPDATNAELIDAYRTQYGVQQRQPDDNQVSMYGARPDGTPKGPGYFGELSTKSRPDTFSGERTIGVNFDGKDYDVPLIVPTLTHKELQAVLHGQDTDGIVRKAVEHAKKRLAEGKSPYASKEDYTQLPAYDIDNSPKNDLPTFDQFRTDARPLNPSASDDRLKQAWQENYGVLGAREKKPGFWDSFSQGLKQGVVGLQESAKGLQERQLDPNDPLKKFAREAGDSLAQEASKLGVPQDLQSKPFWDRVTDPEWMGNFLGNTLAQSSPSLAGAVVGGAAGALSPIPGGAAIGATIGLGGVSALQEAGQSYRQAYEKYINAGFSEEKAHANAYEVSGVAGAVSGMINALAVPASMMSPAKSMIKNLFMRYVANVAIDTGDQATGNLIAKASYDPSRNTSEGVPEAALGSALLGAPETMGAVKLGVMPNRVAQQRATPDQGIKPDLPSSTGETTLQDTPLTHVDPILKTKSVDGAIDTARKVTDDIPIDMDALEKAVGTETKIELDKAQQEADAILKTEELEKSQTLLDDVQISKTVGDVTEGSPLDISKRLQAFKFDAVSPQDLPDAPVSSPAYTDASVGGTKSKPTIQITTDPPRTRMSKPQYEALSDILSLSDTKMVLYEKGTGSRKNLDGFVDRGIPNTIFVNANSVIDPSTIAFHELQHIMQKSEIFDQYRSVLKEELTSGAIASAKSVHGKKLKGDALFEEIMADVHGDAMSRPAFHEKLIQKIEQEYGEAKTKTKMEQFVQGLREKIARITQLITQRDWRNKDGKNLTEQYVKNLERVHDALATALAKHYKAKVEVQKVADAKPVTGFTTAKGSTYVVGEGGVTTRNKAPRPEHPGEEGPQPTSEHTFYVDDQALQVLSEFQTTGDGKRLVQFGKGQYGIQYTSGKDKGKIEKRTLVKGSSSPDVGLSPVELWNNGSNVHFGNKITAVTRQGESPKASTPKEVSSSEEKERRQKEVLEPTSEPVTTTARESSDQSTAGDSEREQEFQDAFGEDAQEVKDLNAIVESSKAPRAKVQAAEERIQEIMETRGVSQKDFNRLVYGIGKKTSTVKPSKNQALTGDENTVFMPGPNAHGPAYTASEPTQMDEWIRKLQDKHVDLKRLIEAMGQAKLPIPDDLNPIFREEMFHKRAQVRSDEFLMQELKPLVTLMRANNITLEQLDQYAHARHVIKDRLNEKLQQLNPNLAGTPEYEKLAGITDEEARKILNTPKRKAMESLMTRVDAMVNKTRDMMVEYGLESQERIDGWREQYQAYVPLHREGFEEEGKPTGTGHSVRGSTAKDRLGSALKVVDVIANVAQARDQAISRGEKMRPVIALAGLFLKYPNAEIATLSKYAPVTTIDPSTGLEVTIPGDLADYQTPMVKRKTYPSFNDYLAAEGLTNEQFMAEPISERKRLRAEFPAWAQDHAEVKFFPDPTYKGRDNVVNFRISGKDYAIIFNERNERANQIARGLKNLDTAQVTGITKAVAPFTRYMASINTQYNPVFGIKNLIRDVGFVMSTLSSTELSGKQTEVLGNARQLMGGIYTDARAIRRGEVATSPSAQWWERFERVGGPTGYRDLFFTSTERAEAINDLLNPKSWSQVRSMTDFTRKLERTSLFGWLSDYNLMMENALRLSVFKTGVDAGLSDIRAASLAKNISVNFNRKGQLGAQVGSWYAFFNASMQGSARIMETVFERTKDPLTMTSGYRLTPNGKRIITGGILLGAVQAFGLAMMGFEDDDIPEFVKSRNIIIPAPGTEKGYVSIPLPLGFNLLPTIGRLSMETVTNGFTDQPLHVGKKGGELLATLMDTFNPLGSSGSPFQMAAPSVADPLVALGENKDWTGKQIYQEDISGLRRTPGHTRSKDTATLWAIGISKMFNWATGGSDYVPGMVSPNPDAIDYLIGQATGGIGREFVAKPSQAIRSLTTGEELPTYKYPGVGGFFGSASGTTGIRNRFYDNVREVNASAMEIEGRMKHGEKFDDVLREHPESGLKTTALRFQKLLGDLRKEKQTLLSSGGTREQIQAKEKQITNVMQIFNTQVERIKQGPQRQSISEKE